MGTPRKKVDAWNIQPLGSEEAIIRVHIYPTRRRMKNALVAWGAPDAADDVVAVCLNILGARPVVCAIFFNREQLTPGIIAHEAWHATFRWLSSKHIKAVPTIHAERACPDDAPEERGATFHGALVDAITKIL